ncbi:MAG: hypothetical protein QME81_18040 [bacterium]|nr:hypothetical protein [bacterium]
MPERPEERKQWHPVLVDGLRYLLASHLRIDPEHGVAALPTRVDVMVVKRDPDQDLVFPYNHLGIATLVELESPGEWATWRVLCKICVDHLLYRLTENLEQTAHVTLWLLVSRASETFFSLVQRELGTVEPLGSGLWRTVFMGNPLVVVHLQELPLSLETLPLLMVYQGPREREIAKFVLKYAREHPLFMEQAIAFHARAMKEVLVMEGINVEAYRNLANVKDIIDLFGPRILIEEIGEKKFIQEIGEKKVIRQIGEKKFIQEIGEDRLLEDLYEMGPERLQKFIDRKERERGK